MKRVLLAALALGVSAAVLPAAPASAALGSDSIQGGCSFDTDQNAILTGGRNAGQISDLSVTTDATGAPTFATVSCWIIVNGVEAPGTRLSASGFGVQAGVATISFVSGDADWVGLCQQVEYGDGTVDTQCPIYQDPNFPPQSVIDILDAVFGAVNSAFVAYVDPVVCPVLVQLAGSYPGGVTIAPDGDVFVSDPLDLFGGSPVEDCPPYAAIGGQAS